MAKREDFTEEEWKTMQSGLNGAGLLVAISDRGFFDTFKEANALAHHLQEAHEKSDSVLMRDLAAGHERPFGATASPAEAEEKTIAALQQSIATLQAKAPDEVDAYRKLVLDIAQSVAEAAKDVSATESTAIERIRAAMS